MTGPICRTPSAIQPSPSPALSVRQRLLRVTSRLVYQDGVSATGVGAITAAAGVARMSLYRHFPGGKDELVAAAIADRSERAVHHLLRAARTAAGATDPLAVLLALFDVIDENIQDPGWRGCPFLSTAADLPETHPGRAVVLEYKNQLRGRLTELLAEAGAEPERAQRIGGVLILLCEGTMAAGRLTPHERPALLARSVAADLLAREFPAVDLPDR